MAEDLIIRFFAVAHTHTHTHTQSTIMSWILYLQNIQYYAHKEAKFDIIQHKLDNKERKITPWVITMKNYIYITIIFTQNKSEYYRLKTLMDNENE